MKYEERRACVCAYLCISIVIFEISQVSADDCFAAFCLVNRDWLSHRPERTKILYHKTAYSGRPCKRSISDIFFLLSMCLPPTI